MNRNVKLIENLFIHKILIIKFVVKELQSAKFYAMFLISVTLVGVLILSPAFSSLINSVVIGSNGRIAGQQAYVTAMSGSAEDIQAAVDEVDAAGGGNVYIPEGVWDFVPVGTSWSSSNGVRIPSGVNVFGATTERTSGLPEPTYGMSPNDQVVEWKTVLRVPWYFTTVEQYPAFFYVMGDSVRISDIHLQNYKPPNPDNLQRLVGIWLAGCSNFRVDHCFFDDLAGKGVWADRLCHGVIDHNYAVNTVGYCKNGYNAPYVLGYGFFSKPRDNLPGWDDYPLTDFIGQHTSRSVFIEDNYISRWRHSCLTDEGGHMIIRHNTLHSCHGYGDIDCHQYWGKCMEIYNNDFINCLGADPQTEACRLKSGGGTVFNNRIDGTYHDGLANCNWDAGPDTPQWYVWDNDV